MSRIARIAAAALLALAPAGVARAQQARPDRAATGTASQSPGTAAQPPAPAVGACRVRDQVGGRTCTDSVPESVCAAIAREAKGGYTWSGDECP
ncbi:hypothetical protein M446_1394 [Methylobacterium sp. 4-46]|uniref:hypothetical protein n=1 Tax=unclassified Methylobacterium TaxID=2615210 RepID=UPI000165C6DB|nr:MULTISPECIES: hypothetical protein [Methylobacterium]ACA15910.1 hypothetical protein M446_1394 [Methylobacterium sp. 4-46]WFT81627.1 hypothetical protein QA634_07075 [Methylobacterium nodulans]